MKLRDYQKIREKCHRVMDLMKWFMIIGVYRLTCIVGCIEQYHLSLRTGIAQAIHTILIMIIALVIHQIANYIASYRDIGRCIETKKIAHLRQQIRWSDLRHIDKTPTDIIPSMGRKVKKTRDFQAPF